MYIQKTGRAICYFQFTPCYRLTPLGIMQKDSKSISFCHILLMPNGVESIPNHMRIKSQLYCNMPIVSVKHYTLCLYVFVSVRCDQNHLLIFRVANQSHSAPSKYYSRIQGQT